MVGEDRYEGNFDADKLTGQGKIIYSENDSKSWLQYEGSLLDGKRHGQGRLMWIDGGYYEGSWFNDHMQGRGML